MFDTINFVPVSPIEALVRDGLSIAALAAVTAVTYRMGRRKGWLLLPVGLTICAAALMALPHIVAGQNFRIDYVGLAVVGPACAVGIFVTLLVLAFVGTKPVINSAGVA